jgi:hypothetical protein
VDIPSCRGAARFLRVCLWCFAMGFAACSVMSVTLAGHLVTLAVFASSREEGPRGAWAVAAYLCGLVASGWLALAAHEGGHLLAARACGLSPSFARVGPVTFTRVGWEWQAGWTWRHSWFDGVALCRPPAACRWQSLLFIAGGPLGNLAVGIVALPLAVVGPSAVGRCWAALLAVNCAFYGLLSLLPLREALPSDGLAFWRALRGRSA